MQMFVSRSCHNLYIQHLNYSCVKMSAKSVTVLTEYRKSLKSRALEDWGDYTQEYIVLLCTLLHNNTVHVTIVLAG